MTHTEDRRGSEISDGRRAASRPMHRRTRRFPAGLAFAQRTTRGAYFLEGIATMTKRFLLPVVVLLLAGAGTAVAQDVRYNFDKSVNFAAFRTYKWVTIKGATPLTDLADRQVKAAVDAELAAKGLTKSNSETADLYIGYQAAVGQEKEYTSFDSGWGYGPGWGGGWYGGGGGMTTGQTSTIYVGQLALDMYAASPHTLVWRGNASKTLDPKAKPEKQQKNLQKAVAKMLKNYPPVVKK
jgi:hypothetical protein